MKKSKITIEKVDGKIQISNGITKIIGFQNYREARKFLKKFL